MTAIDAFVGFVVDVGAKVGDATICPVGGEAVDICDSACCAVDVLAG